jgi:hypothetical protein
MNIYGLNMRKIICLPHLMITIYVYKNRVNPFQLYTKLKPNKNMRGWLIGAWPDYKVCMIHLGWFTFYVDRI